MAKDEKALSQEDKDRVVSWVQEKWGEHGARCPVCRTGDWGVGDHLVSTPVIGIGGNVGLGGVSYPFAQLVCKNCGNTQFLNAVMIGLMEPSKALKEEAAPEVSDGKS